ncbi:hypothetical protein BKA66DRAFT_297023 [Pyrenochaeta sp. MPI-SDFR-AT-0127]|nr:hypothetical protein BKA66DRAFT_297023 [Pyrenochaeta sp. MPI-SDFR-AT-0127]
MSATNATSSTRRRHTSNKLTQRKRAPIACQFCRLRKTKCDGVKPICGFCQHHDAQCIWGVATEDTQSSPTEQEILRRLEELKELLSGPRDIESNVQSSSITHRQERPTSPTTAASLNSVWPLDASASPFDHTRCESFLNWPIFRTIIDPVDVAVESFVLECGHAFEPDDPVANSPSSLRLNRHANGLVIQDDLFVPLCRKFLDHVHPRNPILDESQLIRYAKCVAEHGLEWDGPSCLVLVACAIASYTAPWERKEPDHAQAKHSEYEDAAAAETFYLAAKKRFGLLGRSLIDIQCLFFASVYEKYTLNPLQAWFLIQQASSRLQAYLKRRSNLNTQPESGNDHTSQEHLVQRVFWSVYKAEHELLPELPIQSSGIEVFTRADSMFPSPPVFQPKPGGTSCYAQDTSSEERSWAFYLAEISIRRTMSDTIFTLYRKGESYWLNHIHSLLRQCEECETQVQLWHSHLPALVHFSPGQQPDNELAFFLQGRFYQWRSYILKPLLYYALHRSVAQDLPSKIVTCTQELMSVCAESIVHYDRHHRHGGTWFTCRGSFSSALLILGVVLKNDPFIAPPSNWRTLVARSVSTLHKWESKSPDIQKLRITLERLISALHDSQDNFNA